MIFNGTRLQGATVRDRVNIVQNGLTYYIDAGDPSSYSGSGSSITDISGAGLSASTLVGSPPYRSNGTGSYFSFNGSTQYIITGNMISAFLPTNLNVTIETWVSTFGTDGVITTEQGTPPSGTTLNQGFHDVQQNIVGGDLYQGVWDGSDNTGPVNGPVTGAIWQQYVMTYDSATDTVSSYIDGGNVETLGGVNRVSPVNYGGLFTYYYGIMAADPQSFGDGSALVGDWSVFRVYTRALTATEVLQNYLATYPRYA